MPPPPTPPTPHDGMVIGNPPIPSIVHQHRQSFSSQPQVLLSNNSKVSGQLSTVNAGPSYATAGLSPPPAALYKVNNNIDKHNRYQEPTPVFLATTTTTTTTTIIDTAKCVKVILLNKKELFIPIEPKLQVDAIYSRVCDYLVLRESEYFGLAHIIDGQFCFLNPKTELQKLLPRGWKFPRRKVPQPFYPQITLYFRVQYYVENIKLLRDKSTRALYYAQLHENLLNYNHLCTEERCFQLAAYAIQADVGSYDPTQHTDGYFDPREYFPPWFLKLHSIEYLVREVPKMHQDQHKLSRYQAQMAFIKEIFTPPSVHNLHFYQLKKRKADTHGTSWLGICPGGVDLYEEEKHGFKIFVTSFSWHDIQKLHIKNTKFEVKVIARPEDRVFRYYMDSKSSTKYLLDLCTNTHQCYRAQKDKLKEMKFMEEKDMHVIRGYKERNVAAIGGGRMGIRPQSQDNSMHDGSNSIGRESSVISAHSSNTSGIISDNHDKSHETEDLTQEYMIVTPPSHEPASRRHTPLHSLPKDLIYKRLFEQYHSPQSRAVSPGGFRSSDHFTHEAYKHGSGGAVSPDATHAVMSRSSSLHSPAKNAKYSLAAHGSTAIPRAASVDFKTVLSSPADTSLSTTVASQDKVVSVLSPALHQPVPVTHIVTAAPVASPMIVNSTRIHTVNSTAASSHSMMHGCIPSYTTTTPFAKSTGVMYNSYVHDTSQLYPGNQDPNQRSSLNAYQVQHQSQHHHLQNQHTQNHSVNQQQQQSKQALQVSMPVRSNPKSEYSPSVIDTLRYTGDSFGIPSRTDGLFVGSEPSKNEICATNSNGSVPKPLSHYQHLEKEQLEASMRLEAAVPKVQSLDTKAIAANTEAVKMHSLPQSILQSTRQQPVPTLKLSSNAISQESSQQPKQAEQLQEQHQEMSTSSSKTMFLPVSAQNQITLQKTHPQLPSYQQAKQQQDQQLLLQQNQDALLEQKKQQQNQINIQHLHQQQHLLQQKVEQQKQELQQQQVLEVHTPQSEPYHLQANHNLQPVFSQIPHQEQPIYENNDEIYSSAAYQMLRNKTQHVQQQEHFSQHQTHADQQLQHYQYAPSDLDSHYASSSANTTLLSASTVEGPPLTKDSSPSNRPSFNATINDTLEQTLGESFNYMPNSSTNTSYYSNYRTHTLDKLSPITQKQFSHIKEYKNSLMVNGNVSSVESRGGMKPNHYRTNNYVNDPVPHHAADSTIMLDTRTRPASIAFANSSLLAAELPEYNKFNRPHSVAVDGGSNIEHEMQIVSNPLSLPESTVSHHQHSETQHSMEPSMNTSVATTDNSIGTTHGSFNTNKPKLPSYSDAQQMKQLQKQERRHSLGEPDWGPVPKLRVNQERKPRRKTCPVREGVVEELGGMLNSNHSLNRSMPMMTMLLTDETLALYCQRCNTTPCQCDRQQQVTRCGSELSSATLALDRKLSGDGGNGSDQQPVSQSLHSIGSVPANLDILHRTAPWEFHFDYTEEHPRASSLETSTTYTSSFGNLLACN